MSKITTLQSNFTAGEFSPKLYGRVDIDRYANAVKLARNGYAFVHGGWRWRMGTRYVAEIKNSSAPARLIPYIIDESEAYAVELSEGVAPSTTSYGRFYTGAGRVEIAGTPVEVHLGSPHIPVARTKYAQDDGVLYVTNHYPNAAGAPTLEIIERITPTSFATAVASVFPQPSSEIQETPQATLSLSALTGVITATASAAFFQNADVNRYLRAGVGYAKITGFTSPTIVTIDTTALGGRDFSALPYAISEWLVDGSPQATLTPSGFTAIGTSINLTLGANGWKDNAQFSHVGKYVEINGGFCEITSVTSAVIAVGKIWALLSSATAAGAGGWVLRRGFITLLNAITFHEQRMILANSIDEPGTTYSLREWAEPQTIFLSVIAAQEFSVGSSDDDAVELLAKSETVTPVEHLVSFGDLIAFTGTTVFRIAGGVEKPITPTNYQIKAQSEDGSNYVRPAKVGNELMYVEASGQRVMALGYRAESDRFQSGDISTLAEHLFRVGIVDMAYARRPDPLLLCVLADGTLAVCALDREQNVVGWSLCDTDGLFEAVCVTPYNNQSLVHFIVNRTIGGATKRYVERWEDGRETDCCVVGTGPSSSLWSGFSHLEGETLDVIADGIFVGQKTVSGGNITLDNPATAIEAGLHYDGRLQLLKIEVAGQAGTNQADAVSVHKVVLRVQDSVSALVRGKRLVFGTAATLSSPPVTFTGDKPIGVIGTSNDEILIERDQPYPMTLLCVMRQVSINQG